MAASTGWAIVLRPIRSRGYVFDGVILIFLNTH